MPIWAVIIEAVLASLLVMVGLYGIRLNRRLSDLRNDNKVMRRALLEFAERTDELAPKLDELQTKADINTEELKALLSQAEPMRRNLAAILQQGDGLSRRLEERLTMARIHLGVKPKASARMGGHNQARDRGHDKGKHLDQMGEHKLDDIMANMTPSKAERLGFTAKQIAREDGAEPSKIAAMPSPTVTGKSGAGKQGKNDLLRALSRL